MAVVISLAFGALLTYGPRGLTFEAQELIGGFLSIIAVVFVTWMIFWMARAARGMAGELRGRVDDAADGTVWSLAVVAIFAVGREGLETALFLWAATQAVTQTGAGAAPTWEPLLGAALGLATAVLLGYLMYRGALRINLTRFFTWTGVFLIFVAAGVLSYGIHDLQEAGFLPGLNNLAFDVSDTIPPGTWYATLLKGVFNFSPVTTKLEALAWVLYVVPTLTLFLRSVRRRASAQAPPRVPGAHRLTHHPKEPSIVMRPALLLAVVLAVPALAACTENAPSGGGGDDVAGASRALTVSSTDSACDLSATEAPAGTLSFDVTNAGTQVTEFYLLGEDGLRIVAEVENVGPQLSRQLVVNAPAGEVRHRLQAGDDRRGHPRRLHRHRVRRGGGGQRERPGADRPGAVELRRVRPGPVRPAAAEDAAVRGRVRVRRRRPGPRDLRRRAGALGADRDRRRVVRRPRPPDGRPRGRPRARPGVDRLAPDREGPVARARRRTTRRSRPRSGRRTPTT